MSANLLKPDFLFEISWEVCNRVGSIHTVVSTKALNLVNDLGNNYILIGPDLVHERGDNPEFIADHQLLSSWRKQAEAEGVRIKVGRWNIPAQPMVVLVDFSDFFSKKDDIFSQLWDSYKLDSLSGQWDYIEPALFGYAAGKVIESYTKYNLSIHSRIVAQFHEWMTGTGLLYIKKALPQVATNFTTHATILGRTIARNGLPLHGQLSQYNPEDTARELNIVSKYSLEKICAHEADAFTSISEITSGECTHFLDKSVDLITPNGFEDSIVPQEPEFLQKRKSARSKLLKVASSLIQTELPEDTFIISTCGRYEFHNKGMNLFIQSLNELEQKNLNQPILAFFFVSSNHYGARRDLICALDQDGIVDSGSKILTHNLHEAESDLILESLKKVNLNNESNSKVKVIFVPAFLNGNDGIFNLPFYDLLTGMDQTVFPSYYEPWGYAPLESLAFGIPTITTNLSGIGNWINHECKNFCNGITIIQRTDTNEKEVIAQLTNQLLSTYYLNEKERNTLSIGAKQLAQTALWRSLIFYYKQSYSISLQKSAERVDLYVDFDEKPVEQVHEQIVPNTNEPHWSRIIIKSKLPDELSKLNEIIKNIWWTWDDDAQELFETIDPQFWKASDYNPAILFEQVPYKRLLDLSKDADYLQKVDKVYQCFQTYMEGKKELTSPKIAYFSMEFGFHDSLKLYSGGLGILAGDYLKEASDSKVNLIAVSLLYRFGYFTQMITTQGEQQAIYDYQHFSKIPITPLRNEAGESKIIEMNLPGRIMYARVWKMDVGRVVLYLLDTDIDKNLPEDRAVTHQLYGGDRENRLKQEILLGVGGIRALQLAGIEPDLFHSNEGHSAFIGLERIRNFMLNQQLTFAEAKEIVRASTLFTTHTPVPAGHDHFEEDMLRKYLGHYPGRLNISWETFMALGRENPNDWNEKFNMSYLAAHLAQELNGVSMLHGAVTREMFTNLWSGYLPEELHIGYVTNGVHWSTWTAPAWKKIYARLFDNQFVDNQSKIENWEKIHEVSDAEIWDTKQQLRTRLITGIKERFKENWIKRHEDPKQIIALNNTLSDKALTVVFARRFATYKRAYLLFRNLDRLAKLVNNPAMPIQFIFAGKAHPADKAGQELIRMIVETSKRPEFLGKIIFLQGYSIQLAKLLVSGSDVWLNTPTRPLEASGTSGEKAVMNGTLHFSVLDGWWVEGYQPEAGWALTNKRTYENEEFQDDLDAEIIYSIFETEVLPAFYNRNDKGISTEWTQFIKNTIAGVSPKFTTRRMINDYINQYYSPLFDRSKKIIANDYEMAKRLSVWKRKMTRAWQNIEILEVKVFEKNTETIDTGSEYPAQVVLNLNEINPENVGVEIIVTENTREVLSIIPFSLQSFLGGKAVFIAKITSDRSGTFNYGIRVFPVHEMLPNRQDFSLLKWI